MKAGKLAIQPWLVCQYNKNMLVDLLSSVIPLCVLFVLGRQSILQGWSSSPTTEWTILEGIYIEVIKLA